MPVASSTFWPAGPAPPGSAQVVAVQARGRVIDRPQAVAAVAAGVIGEPPPGEEFAPQGAAISRRRVGRAGRRPVGSRPSL